MTRARLLPASVSSHGSKKGLAGLGVRVGAPRKRQGRVMSAPSHDRQGTDLLADEIKEEAGRLVHHPVAEVQRLKGVVEEGESAATPLILFLGVAIVLAVVAAVVTTVVFLAYYEG